MNISESENRIQVLSIIVLIALAIIGCMVGSFVMNNFSNTMLGFNGPAIGVLAIGELIWMKVRSILQKCWDKQESQRDSV